MKALIYAVPMALLLAVTPVLVSAQTATVKPAAKPAAKPSASKNGKLGRSAQIRP